MIRWITVLGLAFVAGCNQGGPHRPILHEQLTIQRELLGVLKTVQDADSMKTATTRLKELSGKGQALAEKAQKLPTPTAVETRRLDPDFQQLRKLLREQAAELERIESLPGGRDFILQFRPDPESP